MMCCLEKINHVLFLLLLSYSQNRKRIEYTSQQIMLGCLKAFKLSQFKLPGLRFNKLQVVYLCIIFYIIFSFSHALLLSIPSPNTSPK